MESKVPAKNVEGEKEGTRDDRCLAAEEPTTLYSFNDKNGNRTIKRGTEEPRPDAKKLSTSQSPLPKSGETFHLKNLESLGNYFQNSVGILNSYWG